MPGITVVKTICKNWWKLTSENLYSFSDEKKKNLKNVKQSGNSTQSDEYIFFIAAPKQKRHF